jgi:hypothetical protein
VSQNYFSSFDFNFLKFKIFPFLKVQILQFYFEIDFVWCGLIVFQRKNYKESLFEKKVSQTRLNRASQNVKAVNFIRATDK